MNKRILLFLTFGPLIALGAFGIVVTTQALLDLFGLYGCAMFVAGALWSALMYFVQTSDMFTLDAHKVEPTLAEKGLSVTPEPGIEGVFHRDHTDEASPHTPLASALLDSTALTQRLDQSVYDALGAVDQARLNRSGSPPLFPYPSHLAA